MAYLTLSGGRKLFYEEEGTGRPVVFLHGWKASANVYRKSNYLLQNCRCIRYDHCGHMRSDSPDRAADLVLLAEDLHGLITALQLEKPILVGWSLGGMTVLEYVRRYGCAHLEKLVLVDAGYRHDGWSLQSLTEDLWLLKQSFHEFMRHYYNIRVPGFPALPVQEQDEQIRAKLEGFDPEVIGSLYAAMLLRDHRDVLPNITCPTAVFHAGIQPVCTPEAARYYEDHIAGPVKRVHFEENSHTLLAEDPQRFSAELQAFFDE